MYLICCTAWWVAAPVSSSGDGEARDEAGGL